MKNLLWKIFCQNNYLDFSSFKHKCCLHEIFKWLINGDKKFRQFTNCAHTVSEGFYAAIDIFREINHFIAFGRP